MKMLGDYIKQTICSALSCLQWLAASAFCVTHHPSIDPCDMLRSLDCKPSFAFWEASDYSVAEQRFLCFKPGITTEVLCVISPHHLQSSLLELPVGFD